MGRLAAIAEEHYRKFLPKTYAGLTDPATFFQNLQEDAEQQIQDLEDQIAGLDVPGEEFLAKAGRLRQARLSAEEIVMRETVLLDPATVESEREPQETGYPSTTDLEPLTPEDREFQAAMTEFQEAAEELAEQRSSQNRPPNRLDPTTLESPPKA